MTPIPRQRRTPSLRLVAVIALAGAAVLGAPAHADPPSIAGRTCGFSSVNDPTGILGNPDTQIGEIHGGPIVVADLPVIDASTMPPTVTFDQTGNPASGTIVCALQVNGTGVYTDPDAVSASASGTGTVTLPDSAISYTATATDSVFSCTTWIVTDAHGDSDSLYFDDTSGEFLTDPSAAHCALAISASTPSDSLFCPILDTVEPLVPGVTDTVVEPLEDPALLGPCTESDDFRARRSGTEASFNSAQSYICVDGANAGTTCVYE